MADQRRVLITGAAGNIGRFLTNLFADRYSLVLADIARPSDDRFPFIDLNITDADAVRRACEGIDTVVHLAADPSMYAPWESLLPNNLIGLYQVFEGAHQAGCRRVVFASSINAVFGYPADVQVHTNMPVRPINLYGATKAWGEAVARVYADTHNMSALCLRFGWVIDRTSKLLRPDHEWLDIALTYEDLGRLVGAAIDAPDTLRFGIFHGISNNRYKRLDLTDARTILGYDPQDDAFALAGMPGSA
jgi:nucleoside-diphosphate-sugar epimerase